VFLERVALQRAKETSLSFLTAAEARKYADEAAEALLSAHQSAAGGADVAAAAAAATAADPVAAAAAAALAKHTPRHRDYKPLEGTCWLKGKVLSYLSNTPAAAQNEEACKEFVQQAQKMLADNAAARASAAASASGSVLSAAQSASAIADVRLTTLELLQLLNLRPTSMVEVHRAIEECEERLHEQDVVQLLELVQRTLPPNVKQQQQQGGGEVDDEEQQQPEEQGDATAAQTGDAGTAAAAPTASDAPAPMEQ
jgi:hypothetical protein